VFAHKLLFCKRHSGTPSNSTSSIARLATTSGSDSCLQGGPKDTSEAEGQKERLQHDSFLHRSWLLGYSTRTHTLAPHNSQKNFQHTRNRQACIVDISGTAQASIAMIDNQRKMVTERSKTPSAKKGNLESKRESVCEHTNNPPWLPAYHVSWGIVVNTGSPQFPLSPKASVD
jgi:hypothetical protein